MQSAGVHKWRIVGAVLATLSCAAESDYREFVSPPLEDC